MWEELSKNIFAKYIKENKDKLIQKWEPREIVNELNKYVIQDYGPCGWHFDIDTQNRIYVKVN